jgi:hypothetical protein
MRARPRNQGRETGDEVERIDDDRSGAILPVPAQGLDHAPVGCERIGRNRRAGQVPAQALECVAIVGLDLDLGVRRTTLGAESSGRSHGSPPRPAEPCTVSPLLLRSSPCGTELARS